MWKAFFATLVLALSCQTRHNEPGSDVSSQNDVPSQGKTAESRELTKLVQESIELGQTLSGLQDKRDRLLLSLSPPVRRICLAKLLVRDLEFQFKSERVSDYTFSRSEKKRESSDASSGRWQVVFSDPGSTQKLMVPLSSEDILTAEPIKPNLSGSIPLSAIRELSIQKEASVFERKADITREVDRIKVTSLKIWVKGSLAYDNRDVHHLFSEFATNDEKLDDSEFGLVWKTSDFRTIRRILKHSKTFHASRARLFVFLALLPWSGFFLNGCKTTGRPLPKAIPIEGSDGFYLANMPGGDVSHDLLAIERASIAKLQVGDVVLGRVNFGTSQLADFVHIEICPTSNNAPCKQDTTATRSYWLTESEPGHMQILAQACVYPQRAVNPKKNCGEPNILEWYQGPRADSRGDTTLTRIRKLLSAKRELGIRLEEQLQKIARIEIQCKEARTPVKNSERKFVVSEMYALSANLANLGPLVLGEAITDVDRAKDLARFETPAEDTTRADLKALHLAQSEDNLKTEPEYIIAVDVRDTIRGSVGHQKDKTSGALRNLSQSPIQEGTIARIAAPELFKRLLTRVQSPTLKLATAECAGF